MDEERDSGIYVRIFAFEQRSHSLGYFSCCIEAE